MSERNNAGFELDKENLMIFSTYAYALGTELQTIIDAAKPICLQLSGEEKEFLSGKDLDEFFKCISLINVSMEGVHSKFSGVQQYLSKLLQTYNLEADVSSVNFKQAKEKALVISSKLRKGGKVSTRG